MKRLEKVFKSNADGTGIETFEQIKRIDRVAMYRRTRKNGTIHCYEVFEVKIVPKGTVFAKGTPPTTEDAESYPGKSSFGKFAYCCSTEERAHFRFDELVEKIKNRTTEAADDADLENSDVAPLVRSGRRGRPAKAISMPIPRSGERFTMRQLMLWSGASQPNLYNRLKVLITNQLVSVAGEIRQANTRGKSQIVYQSHTDDFAQNIVATA
jgi:hypothetical protein